MIFQAVKKNKQEMTISVDKIIVATGERPRYPDIPGAKEYCITRQVGSSGMSFFICILEKNNTQQKKLL